MQPTMKAISLATIFFAISVSPSQMLACGWWGDGELNLESGESTFFIPRGNKILSDPADMARLSTAYRTGEHSPTFLYLSRGSRQLLSI